MRYLTALFLIFTMSISSCSSKEQDYGASLSPKSVQPPYHNTYKPTIDTAIVDARFIDALGHTLRYRGERMIQGLSALHEFTYDESIDIRRYQVSVFRNGHIIRTSREENSWLCTPTLLYFRDSLQPHDVLIFDDILYVKNNGDSMKLRPLTHVISNVHAR